jgi:multiphosphoryl transfer protein
MIGTPAAALIAEHLASLVDFFSIGTNDLTQYSVAADRGLPKLAELLDPFHPGVLRLVDICVQGPASCGIPVAVCGEVAADPRGAIILAALGINELSVDVRWIGMIRASLMGVSRAMLDELRVQVLAARDVESARALTKQFLLEDT